jgi:hypothetical protein
MQVKAHFWTAVPQVHDEVCVARSDCLATEDTRIVANHENILS